MMTVYAIYAIFKVADEVAAKHPEFRKYLDDPYSLHALSRATLNVALTDFLYPLRDGMWPVEVNEAARAEVVRVQQHMGGF